MEPVELLIEEKEEKVGEPVKVLSGTGGKKLQDSLQVFVVAHLSGPNTCLYITLLFLGSYYLLCSQKLLRGQSLLYFLTLNTKCTQL